MQICLLPAKLDAIPVDFLADPDGSWDYETLARETGFDAQWGELSIGALTEPFAGFPEGAAVVTFTSGSRCSVALVDCTSATRESDAHESAEREAAEREAAAFEVAA
jgi:hypothetical protein